VLGYPHLFTSDGKTCSGNFLTSSNEKKLNETGDKLDAAINGRSDASGFTFVDRRQAFLPHEVCSSEEWLNGQSWPLEESYYPNVKGQKEFTSEVEGPAVAVNAPAARGPRRRRRARCTSTRRYRTPRARRDLERELHQTARTAAAAVAR
jgi:hypothetical protein